MKKAVCIIPARLGSYRFPGKALHPIYGLPMIEHVYKRATLASQIDQVYVATPNEEIVDAVDRFGGAYIRTTDDVRRGSDRVAQAVAGLGYEIVVNLQGDEPLVRPDTLDRAVRSLAENPELQCVNVVYLADHQHAEDENEVKVVTDSHDFMMYLSREPIPAKWFGDKEFKHKICLGLMVFSKASLELYASLPSTPLEIIESIDQLRFLEHQIPIKVLTDNKETHSVDSPDDIAKVEALMLHDEVARTYCTTIPPARTASG